MRIGKRKMRFERLSEHEEQDVDGSAEALIQ